MAVNKLGPTLFQITRQAAQAGKNIGAQSVGHSRTLSHTTASAFSPPQLKQYGFSGGLVSFGRSPETPPRPSDPKMRMKMPGDYVTGANGRPIPNLVTKESRSSL